MKVTAIETLRTAEFATVLWVRVHTDAGIVGLGETFYGAGAVEAHLQDTLAARLLGKDPLHIEALHREMLNLPMAQSSTGAEYRAASAVDPAFNGWVLGRTPTSWGRPEELVGAAVLLASSRASDYVNGQSIDVDGGMLAVL